jgi:hypothetical protein
MAPPPLTGRDQALTLRQLNHVIQYQLAHCSRQISPRFEHILVKNGMVSICSFLWRICEKKTIRFYMAKKYKIILIKRIIFLPNS